MLKIQFFRCIDKRLARLAATVSLLAISQFPLAQAGEQTPPLPPGTITVEDTHYPPVAPGSTAPQLPADSPRPSAEDMVDAAKRNVGKIDQDLRKDSPPASDPASPATAAKAPTKQQILEKALAGPVVQKETPKPGETTMEDFVRPDGQRVTKVTGPNGISYCVTQISVGNTKGEDIMQKGAVSRTTNCGVPF